MQVQVNNITDSTKKTWEKLLKCHPHNTVFQSYKMYSFYTRVQNFKPFLFLCMDDFDNCIGVLLAVRIKEGRGLLGYLSSRIVVYGGPIIKEDISNKEDVLSLLLDVCVSNLKNNCMFIQFRNFFEWTNDEKQIFKNYGFSFKERLNLLVPTSSKDEVLSNISSSKRRQIRNGLKSGVKIVDPESINEVKQFFNLLFDLYKNKVKKPLPSWSFFEEFYKSSKNNELGIIKLVKINKRVIGGVLCPITGNRNIYEWYVVGLDKDFKHHFPSVLATWAPIEFALNSNLHHFDFMGLGKPKDPYGVRDFKMKFGKNIVNYGRFARRNKVLYLPVEFVYNLLRILKKV